jgi:predicted AlkP superfamily pyrophosphatase or phosphodiesterase
VTNAVTDPPLLPDYAGACLTNVVPTLLGSRRDGAPTWFPSIAFDAPQVLLLVLDGLGWQQLQQHRALMPLVASMTGGPITSVVPSTTATALTSITTGLSPGEHGVVGYRIDVHGDVLNVLRWSTPRGDARRAIPPESMQPFEPFLGRRPPVVTKAEFLGSGFSTAHLRDVQWRGWRVPSTLITEVRELLAEGEPFVYAYYDGIDKVAHEYGLGAHYEAELVWVDRLVGDLLEVLPPGAVLLLTADHGQVDVGANVLTLDPDLLGLIQSQSGEARARWLHAVDGRADDLLATAVARYGDQAWVVSKVQVIDEGWFGSRVSEAAADRLGDVLLAARSDVAFDDPADTGPFTLIARHGSLTEAEMLVPLVASRK